jgi:hypothetical protein
MPYPLPPEISPQTASILTKRPQLARLAYLFERTIPHRCNAWDEVMNAEGRL